MPRLLSWRFAALAGLLMGICFTVGLFIAWRLPDFEHFVRLQIEELSRKKLPVRILPGRFSIDWLHLSVVFTDVDIQPKPQVQAYFDPFKIAELRAQLDVLGLFLGDLGLSEIDLRGADLKIRIPETKKSDSPPLAGLFKIINQIPVAVVSLSDIKANFQYNIDAKNKAYFGVDLKFFTAEKSRLGLETELEVNRLSFLDSSQAKPLTISLAAQALISPNKIYLTELRATRDSSFLVASAELNGDVEALEFPAVDADVRTTFFLEPMQNVLTKVFPQKMESVPPFSGKLYSELHIKKTKQAAEPDVDIKLKTEDFRIDKRFFLDRIEIAGSFKKGNFIAKEAKMSMPGGNIELQNAQATKDDSGITIKAHAIIPHVDLFALLPSLGTPIIPVWAQLNGDFPDCFARLTPDFKITCRGEVHGKDALIKSDVKEKNRILAIKQMDATGEMSFTKNGASYKAELTAPKSKGRSSGDIGFKTGFDIQYEADNLDFSDVETLGELKLDGQVSVKGSTSGNSDFGIFNLEGGGHNLWLEDWYLGSARTKLAYKSGVLSFPMVEGHYATSRYKGKLAVDFPNKNLTMDFKSDFFDLKDLFAAADRHFKIPVDIAGTGQASIQLQGPFQLNALSYNLKAELFKGSVQKETFDQAQIQIHARKGEMETQKVEMTKGQAIVRLDGKGHPNGEMDAILTGKNIRLENLNSVAALGLQAGGLLEFDMKLKGPMLAPRTDLRGSVSQTSIADQSFPDSTFRLSFNKSTIEGGAALMGRAIKTDFVLPLDPSAPFAFNFSTDNWKFAPLISALSGQVAKKEYDGTLTSQIALNSNSGGFWASSGRIRIGQFSIQRGALTLGTPEPILITMQDGQMNFNKFAIEGDTSSLRIVNSNERTDKLDTQLTGKLDLSLVALLLPIFEDLHGSLSVACNIRAGEKPTRLLGSSFIEHGYLKIFDFPHPLQEVHADALFNEKKLVLNSLRGDFAKGKLTADGNIEFLAYRNFPLQMNLALDNVSMKVPEKVETQGSGRFTITGNWFPYLLKGRYDIREGLVTQEFEAAEGGVGGVNRSAFLPSSILQKTASPLNLDLSLSFPKGVQIKNKMVDGKALGELQVRGSVSQPILSGQVNADHEMKVTFRDTIIFEVLNGNAVFDDPLDSTNPSIYLSARTRLPTPTQDYDINMVVQGRAKDPKVNLTSLPPRDEKDIISLLALGTDPSTGDAASNTGPVQRTGVSSSSQGSGTGAVVGTELFSKPLTTEFKKTTGIDIQVTSGLDDTDTTVPKVIASRQFSPNFSVLASRSFGQDPKTDATLKYRLTKKISVLGSWEGLDHYDTSSDTLIKEQQDPTTLNKVGLDLEYKLEFK